jgi:hypothetical protein
VAWPLFLVLSAAGVLAFWSVWFLSGQHLTAEPDCYRHFENTFPLPDGIMAMLMIVLAGLMRRRSAFEPLVASSVCGMLLCLGSLDTLYHIQQGGFSDLAAPSTWRRLFIISFCFALALVLLRGLWVSCSDAPSGPSSPAPPGPSSTAPSVPLRAPALVLGVYSVLVAAFWLARFTALFAPYDGCLEVIVAAFALADAITVVTALVAIAGLLTGQRFGVIYGLITTAGTGFATLSLLGLALFSPELFSGSATGVAIGCCIMLVALAAFARWLWRS